MFVTCGRIQLKAPTSFLRWSATEPTVTKATTGPLYQPRMMGDDECGAIGRMLGKGDGSPPQTPHEMIRARTRTAAVGSRRLTS
jgi:hypothetical protein